MTQEQIRWAKQHDWFVAVVKGTMGFSDGVKVRDISYAAATNKNVKYRIFRDYRALREWAGY